jgi:hypothetical protein
MITLWDSEYHWWGGGRGAERTPWTPKGGHWRISRLRRPSLFQRLMDTHSKKPAEKCLRSQPHVWAVT